MNEYKNILSKLSDDELDLMMSDLPDLTQTNINNIKDKFDQKIMKQENRKKMKIRNIAKRGLLSAACVSIIFVGVVNMNVTFAAQLLNIPIISDITNFVTINKMELYDKYRAISVVIPKVEGMGNSEVEDEINELLRSRGLAVYDKALENSSIIESESKKLGFLTSIPETVEQTFYKIRNDEKILSFKVVTTEIKASAYETSNFYTIDLVNSKLLTLDDLFENEYDYIEVINQEIIRQMKLGNEKEDKSYFIEYFTSISESSNFYINEDNNLVIVFNEYEVAAGYMGMPEFIIDKELFGSHLSKEEYLSEIK